MSSMMLKMARALKCGGDVYSITDIVNRVKNGDMQSFVNGDAWAVTTVHDYPRKRVLHVDYAVGDLKQLRAVFDEIYAWAKEHNVHMVRAIGRNGWIQQALGDGWRTDTRVFVKEM